VSPTPSPIGTATVTGNPALPARRPSHPLAWRRGRRQAFRPERHDSRAAVRRRLRRRFGGLGQRADRRCLDRARSPSIEDCAAIDVVADGVVGVNELVRAVGSALGGCQ
jgi:hypothetical protein